MNYGAASTETLTTNFNYGMVVNNCSGAPSGSADGLGYSYKNTFSNFNVNLQSELDNKGAFNPSAPVPSSGGLEFKCNDFNTRIDFDVTVADGPGSITSIIRDQGLCALPEDQAGNSFTTCTLGSDEQISFDANSLVDPSNSVFKYRDQPGIYSCTYLTSSVNNCPIGSSNSCPSNFSLCSSIPCLVTAYNDAQLAAKQNLNSYQQLIDGGNTSFLLGKINSSMPPGQLKNLLISKSPYLSDEVLIAMIKRINSLPPGQIKQIVIANSPVTNPVMTAIQNKGLPVEILNDILIAQTGISERSEKEKELNYYTFQAKLSEVTLIQGYLDIENIDSVKAIARKDTTLAGLFNLIEILIANRDYAEAQICLADIHTKEGTIHSDECKLNEIRLDLAMNNRTWFDMTSLQVNTIQQIYENNPETAIHARTILAMTKGLQYENYPFDLQNPGHRMSPFSEPKEIFESKGELKVYPNPSSEFTTVEIYLPKSNEEARFTIYNSLGQELENKIVLNNDVLSIETNKLNNGIYLFVLKTNKGIIEMQKIIVSK